MSTRTTNVGFSSAPIDRAVALRKVSGNSENTGPNPVEDNDRGAARDLEMKFVQRARLRCAHRRPAHSPRLPPGRECAHDYHSLQRSCVMPEFISSEAR